ncbi:MAG: pentapeptide repeat-containing protein [Pirellulales bacterium]
MIGPGLLLSRGALLAFACLIASFPGSAIAAIFRWDDGELIPGTEAITVGPGMIVDGLELHFADLAGATLTGASFLGTDLTDALLDGSRLTNAGFSNAEVTGASFLATTPLGFTKEQLYETSSYQAMSLPRIILAENNLSGWDFHGQRLEEADLRDSDLTLVNFANADLRLASLDVSTLAQANFSNADLRQASLTDAVLTDANFAGAIVTETIFASADLTKEQLYATASYQQKDLQGIVLFQNDLTGWNLSAQNLTGADLGATTLAGANLSGAVIVDALLGSVNGLAKEQFYTTASYQQHNLRDIDLSGNDFTGWDFSGQDLSRVGFEGATLRDANLAGAIIQGARFDSTVMRGFTKEQLYSIASYQQKNLQRIRLRNNNLDGWNFSGQDLRGANFSSTSLVGTDFSLADLRGATAFEPDQTTVIRNTIDPDSILITLNLLPGETLVANAGGFLGLPVAFFGQFSIDPTAKLDLTDNAAIVYQAPASAVREQLISGRGGQGLGRGWNGNGITSSAAAAANQSSPESRSIGYALNGSLPLGRYMEFHQFPVEASSVLLAYTRTGDANLDGVVNDDDVTIVGAAYAPGVPQPHWALGDFDYNGFVDDDDVTLLGVFYDPTAEPIATPAIDAQSVTAVPEPSAVALVALAAFTVAINIALRRRNVRRTS